MTTVLIIYSKDTIGDFLHKVIPLYFFLKQKKYTVKIKNTGSRLNDIFIDKFELKPDGLLPSITIDDLIFGKYRTSYNKQFYGITFRKDLLAHFREVFYTARKFPALNGITINIGSLNKNRRKGNDNRLYQDRIADVIVRHPELSFNIVGLSSELVSSKLDQIIKGNPQVLNFLDKTSLLDLINILFHSKLVIVRNTGILHLAGLCNCPILTFYANCSIIDNLAIFTGWRPDVVQNDGKTKENKRLYYTEKWSPLSENVTSIIEYRAYDERYNRSVVDLVSKCLKGKPPTGSRRIFQIFFVLSLFVVISIIWTY